MSRRKKVSKEFSQKIHELRNNRNKRDSIFYEVFNFAMGDMMQLQKLSEWIYEELDVAKTFVKGLEPLCGDNASTAAIGNLELRIERLNSTFTDEILNLDKTSLDKTEDETPDLKIERTFNLLYVKVVPVVRELFGIRHDLDEIYNAMLELVAPTSTT